MYNPAFSKFGGVLKPSHISKREDYLSFFIVSKDQRMDLHHSVCANTGLYRDGSIAVKNVTKNYKESTYAPALKAMEGVEPSEASNPRTVITRSGSTTLL